MHAREATQQTACELELVAGVNGAAGGRARLLERNPRELPAALGPVRHGSVPRARLLWAAALLVEAIATDTPGDPMLPCSPSSTASRMSYGHAERNLAMLRQLEAETRELLASLDQLDPERSAWLQEVTSSGDDPLKQVSPGDLDV
jgi:hypothetical protein